ncbi:TPA: ead/Ea22-like family protein [Klebsiella pneumoniae]|nr:ead/Ea22-like family protein [Klebsiella pneumoniae]
MTDITELAQILKAAATNVKETAHIARYLKATIARQIFKELMTPDNILALVEALEKAQGMETYWKTQCRGITDHCEELQARIAELEESNAQVIQSRDHYKRMTEEGLKQLAEARTVKLPHRNLGHPKLFLLCPFPYYDAEDMEKALAAAGIKVEAQ